MYMVHRRTLWRGTRSLTAALVLSLSACVPEPDDSEAEDSDAATQGDSDATEGGEAPDDEGDSSDKPDLPEDEDSGADTPDEDPDKEGSDQEPEEDPKDDPEDDPGEGPDDDDECPDPPPGPDCDATDVKGKLECIPGVKVLSGSGSSFTFTISQPVNHAKKDGPSFPQKIKLSHKGFDKPLVLKTSGYSSSAARHELTKFVDANVISIEHRFFGSSKPSGSIDWSQMTIKAAADDFHRIYENLKWMYPKRWVNTGGSKGGETVIFHRRFHHCDVDATVAYVAPIVEGEQDPRFNEFLENVGGDKLKDCRERLKSAQRSVLENRSSFVSKLKDSDFRTLGGAEMGFEHQVMEFPFTFFQSSGSRRCSQVPALSASAEEKYRFIEKIHPVRRGADSAIRGMLPYFVQSCNELGWPSSLISHIDDVLKFGDTYTGQTYLPEGVKVSFDPDAMQDIRDWVATKGKRIMLIYGEYDPWTAAKLDLGDARDSYRYIVPEGAHSSRIQSLPQTQRQEAIAHLKRWLED